MRTIHNLKEYKALRRLLRHNMTEAEQKLWLYLRNSQLEYKFRRQAGIGKYVVDFYCPIKKLVIEIDGSQHIIKEKEDKKRTSYLKSLNIKVIRFWNNDVLDNIEGVLEEITQLLKEK